MKMRHLLFLPIIKPTGARNSLKEIAEFVGSMDIKPKIAGTTSNTKEIIPTTIPTKTPTELPT